jgi:hypothetical protein
MAQVAWNLWVFRWLRHFFGYKAAVPRYWWVAGDGLTSFVPNGQTWFCNLTWRAYELSGRLWSHLMSTQLSKSVLKFVIFRAVLPVGTHCSIGLAHRHFRNIGELPMVMVNRKSCHTISFSSLHTPWPTGVICHRWDIPGIFAYGVGLSCPTPSNGLDPA